MKIFSSTSGSLLLSKHGIARDELANDATSRPHVDFHPVELRAEEQFRRPVPQRDDLVCVSLQRWIDALPRPKYLQFALVLFSLRLSGLTRETAPALPKGTLLNKLVLHHLQLDVIARGSLPLSDSNICARVVDRCFIRVIHAAETLQTEVLYLQHARLADQ